MNKKAQGLSGLGIAFMVAMFLFLIGMSQINFIKDLITDVRGTDTLYCASNTLSDGQRVTCLVVDIALPFFIITIISASGGLITAIVLKQ